MPFQVSPGVNVSEIDLTTVVPAVSTTEGAIAIQSSWGPVDQRVLVDSEDRLVNIYHKPNSNTATDFFTAANFLSYGNALYVNRSVGSTANNATSGNTAVLVKNEDHYNESYATDSAHGKWVAKYPGKLGNSLKVSACLTPYAFEHRFGEELTYKPEYGNNIVRLGGDPNRTNNPTVLANAEVHFAAGDIVFLGENEDPYEVKSALGNTVTLTSDYSGAGGWDSNLLRQWKYSGVFTNSPETTSYAETHGATGDAVNIAVIDEDGAFTGQPGTVLEAYEMLSLAADGKTEQGAGNYYKEVINQQSPYIWYANKLTANSGQLASSGATFTKKNTIGDIVIDDNSMTGGIDGSNVTPAQKVKSYDIFKSAEDVDISFLLGSAADKTLAKHLITNIAESRKDCIAVISPERADVVHNNAYSGKERDDIIKYRNDLPSSSYAVMDSGWKYQYDKYNDLYRYVPLNGDTAGLMVQTDNTRDPWWSPAGFNRGNVKNSIKLAYNPDKADRDQLYKKGINPVVTFPGQGTVLFGDKTMLAKPSAFDRINVRRLFIVLEKAISTASKFTLFEFNDDFTRSQFRNMVEPFLRDVQGRRGITDFRVVCDNTNNTGEVIDRNEFIGDIYIKPARSINFIQLNFIAVRTGVEFSEVVGKFG